MQSIDLSIKELNIYEVSMKINLKNEKFKAYTVQNVGCFFNVYKYILQRRNKLTISITSPIIWFCFI